MSDDLTGKPLDVAVAKALGWSCAIVDVPMSLSSRTRPFWCIVDAHCKPVRNLHPDAGNDEHYPSRWFGRMSAEALTAEEALALLVPPYSTDAAASLELYLRIMAMDYHVHEWLVHHAGSVIVTCSVMVDHQVYLESVGEGAAYEHRGIPREHLFFTARARAFVDAGEHAKKAAESGESSV